MTSDELLSLDAYWRAANYLSVGQIYLLDNPLLREPLQAGHVKPRLLGHWGTTPGLNLVYAHLNRVIRARDLLARVASFLRERARDERDAVAIAHRGVLRSAYTLATGWDMLTPMPAKLDLTCALILALDADGTPRIAELNAPLRTRP